MVRWAFMTDPTTGNIGLYDEPVASGAFDDPNAPRNAPLNNPAGNLASVYWHILFDNMEVAFDQSVTITHAAFGAGSTGTSGTPQSAAFDYDDTIVDFDLYTHGLGYEPFALVAVGNAMMSPGYPVQVSPTSEGSARYVSPFIDTSKISLREYRSRGSIGLGAISITYRMLIFQNQRPAEGNHPPQLLDFNSATGITKLGDGRWRADRRYLQVVPGGTPFGLTYGRTIDLVNGAPRFARADGTVFDPIPATVKQGIVAIDGQFATDTVVYGASMNYTGSWMPGEILDVQAP